MSRAIYLADTSRPTSTRQPRTQREAGIEFHGWESRAPALRPIWRDMITGIIAGVIILPPLILWVAPFVGAVVVALVTPGAR